MKKLTAIERQFATDNHNLIYQYLHEHHLCIEDYYEPAATGLILATMAYTRKPELHDNYKFSTIAYKYIKREINHQLEREKAAKRKAPKIPLSYESLGEVPDFSMSDVFDCLDELFQKEVLEQMDKQQRKIFKLIVIGYEPKEICELLKISRSSFYRDLDKIANIVLAW